MANDGGIVSGAQDFARPLTIAKDIIGKFGRALSGKKTSSIAGSREAMPDYAGAGARAQAQRAGTPAPRSKPAVKGAAPVKKVVKKAAKKVAPKKAVAKGVKPNPFAKGKTEAPGMKSKGKKADKEVTMKKFVNVKGKK
jgi:hypothetical protein